MTALPPIPQNPIGETFVWRDWLTKLQKSFVASSATSSSIYINVKDPIYGAKGDGVTDDTLAIQAAITAAGAITIGSSVGAIVFFPPGYYLISNTLNMAVNGVTLLGSGNQASIITTNNRTLDPWIRIADQISVCFHIGIEKLGFYSALGQTAGRVIYINNINGTRLTDLYINNIFKAVEVGTSANSQIMWFQNIWITNIGTNGIGINLTGGNDHYLVNCVMTGGNSAYAGINITGSQATMIQGCEIFSTGRGLVVYPIASTISWLNILNCEFDTCTNGGIYFAADNGAIIQGTTFDLCWTGSNGVGTTLATTGTGLIDGVELSNHRSFQNQNEGLILSGTGTKNVTISSSHFSGNSQSASGTLPGISVKAGVSNFNIVGCISQQMAQRSNSQNWGVLIASGASDHFNISDSLLTTNISGAISDGSTGTTKTILGNPGVASTISNPTSATTLGINVTNGYGLASTVNGTTTGYAVWGASTNPNGYGGYFYASSGTALGVQGSSTFDTIPNITGISISGTDSSWSCKDVSGKITKGGTITTTAGTGLGAVTFAVAFPNICLGVQATVNATGPTSAQASAGTFSTTGVNVYCGDSAGAGIAGSIRWVAFGY